MPRLLTLSRATIPHAERERYLERLKARKRHYEANNCRFWVFEERSLPGAFIEFAESSDADALEKAHATCPIQAFDANRLYTEVELG